MLRKEVSKFTYSPYDIRRTIRTEDFWKYGLNTKDLENLVTKISYKFADKKAPVDELRENNIKGNKVFTCNSLYNDLTIRRTNIILKKKFMFQSHSRDQEVKQLWEILSSEKKHAYVFRTDVKSFFESLPFKEIVNDMFKRNWVSKSTYLHLNNIYLETSKNKYQGLPRGLSISSSLSEYALRNFDQKIVNNFQCIYYSRYVDDIVFVSSRTTDNLEERIQNSLPYDLRLNKSKTYYQNIGTNAEIEYLGYNFNLKNINLSKIAKKKLSKLKTRIIASIRSYVKKDFKFDLLLDRLKCKGSSLRLTFV